MKKVWERILIEFKKLSKREQNIVVGSLVILFLMLAYLIYDPISSSFSRQQQDIEKTYSDIKTAKLLLDRFQELNIRSEEIQAKFKAVETGEAPRSQIERLIKEKAGVSSLPTINNLPAQSFGSGYEQVPFAVQFKTSNLDGLVDFLVELVHGQRPMLLGKFEIRKNAISRELEVDLEVSTLRKASVNATNET